jgi:hypothetical protein
LGEACVANVATSTPGSTTPGQAGGSHAGEQTDNRTQYKIEAESEEARIEIMATEIPVTAPAKTPTVVARLDRPDEIPS